jgi:aminopeptidase N
MKNKGVVTYDVIVKDWGEKAAKATKAASIPTANWIQPNLDGKADRETYAYRQELVYDKGAYLLACIHKEIGEEKFMRFFRTYQKNFAWYPASINQDVPDLLKAITGKDWQPWFQKYFWGTEMPSLPK